MITIQLHIREKRDEEKREKWKIKREKWKIKREKWKIKRERNMTLPMMVNTMKNG